MNYDQAMEHCLFRYVSGSHAYGTNRPDSDEDMRGVFIAPVKYAFDLFQTSFVGSATIDDQLRGTLRDMEDGNYVGAAERIRKVREADQFDLNFSVGTVKRPGVDEELHELRKFLKLAAECNPNIIEYLHIDRLITHETDMWRRIKASRDMFLSKKARYSFAGYAFAQAKRIKNHRGYLLNPPSKKPERADYGLPEDWKIPKEYQRAALSLKSEYLAEGVRGQVIQEKKYLDAMEDWNAYKKWEKERNPKRREMEAKAGYDCKHAMHLIRLCRMAKEILSDGVVHVYRPDRDELRQIINCEWSYEKLMEEADGVDAQLDDLYEKSSLRHKPDHKGIAELYREICEEHYGIKIRS